MALSTLLSTCLSIFLLMQALEDDTVWAASGTLEMLVKVNVQHLHLSRI